MSINLYKKRTKNGQPVLEELLSKDSSTVADKPLVYDSTNNNVKSADDLNVNSVTASCFHGPLDGTAKNATCFNNKTYAEACADILSGCAADSNKLNGKTYSEVCTDILSGTAANATCFAGKTCTEWKEIIKTTCVDNAALATNATCFNGCTYAQACTDIRDGLATQTCADAIQNCADFIQSCVTAIESKIPAQASASNQLADKDFVNSSITTNTANFRGTYACVAELPSTGNTNNDYAFICSLNTTTGNYIYDRYKWVASDSCWVCEYELNTTGFTAEQLASINSGITSNLVAKITDVYDNTVTVCMNGECKGSFNLNQNTDVCIDLGDTIRNACCADYATNAAQASSATNATCFDGCTYACAKEDFRNGMAAAISIGDSCPYQADGNRVVHIPAYPPDLSSCDGLDCTGTVTQVKVGTTAYDPVSGVVSLPAYPVIPTTIQNATCFNGCTYACAKADIRNYTPSYATCTLCPIIHATEDTTATQHKIPFAKYYGSTNDETPLVYDNCLIYTTVQQRLSTPNLCVSDCAEITSAHILCLQTYNTIDGKACEACCSNCAYSVFTSGSSNTRKLLSSTCGWSTPSQTCIDYNLNSNTLSNVNIDISGCSLKAKTACFTGNVDIDCNVNIGGNLNVTGTLTGTANNATCFNGKTYSQAKTDILSGNAASATNATCFGGCTYACAKADFRNYTPSLATCSTCVARCVAASGTCYLALFDARTASTGTNLYVSGAMQVAFCPATGILTTCCIKGITALIAGNPIGCSSTVLGQAGTTVSSGSLELYRSTPLIDFHVNNATADFTQRISAECGVLKVCVNNGTGCTTATQTGCFYFCSDGTLKATCFDGNATNATCFNGCTYACAKADIRSGLTSCTGTVTSVNVSVNGETGTAVTSSGTVTITDVGVKHTQLCSNTDRNILFASGSIATNCYCGVFFSDGTNGKPFTYNPSTGVLKTTCFCGTATNATCFGGCTYAQACTNIRSGLISDIGVKVYCGTTCKCTLAKASDLCLSANAFNANATISTTTYPGACCTGTSNYVVTTKVCCAEKLESIPKTANTSCTALVIAGCCNATTPTNYTWCFCGSNGNMYAPGDVEARNINTVRSKSYAGAHCAYSLIASTKVSSGVVGYTSMELTLFSMNSVGAYPVGHIFIDFSSGADANAWNIQGFTDININSSTCANYPRVVVSKDTENYNIYIQSAYNYEKFRVEYKLSNNSTIPDTITAADSPSGTIVFDSSTDKTKIVYVKNVPSAMSVDVCTSSCNAEYPLVFSTCCATPVAGNRTLYNDSANNLMYNPSTNTLTACCIVGATRLSAGTPTCCTSSVTGQSGILLPSTGGIEVFASTPLIDFHHNNACANYSHRLEGLNGYLRVTATNATGCCAATQSANFDFCSDGNIRVPNSLYVGSTGGRYTGGSIELCAPSPFVDFHFNNYCGDYSSRIINGSQGTTQLIVNNGTGTTTASESTTFYFKSNGNAGGFTNIGTPAIQSALAGGIPSGCTQDLTLISINCISGYNKYCMCLCGCNGKLYNPQGFMVGSCPVALICDIPATPTCVACAECVDLEAWRDCDLYLVGTPHLGATVSYDGPRRLVAAQKNNVSCLYYSYNGKNLYASGDKFTKDCQFVLSGCTLTITM